MQQTILWPKVYKRFIMGILVILVNIFSGENNVYATHAAGTDLTYTYLGNNQYRLEVSFYRDCAGIAEPDSAAILCVSSGCLKNFTVYATKIPGTGQEITTPCTTANTSCNGGSITGIKRFVYQKVITLISCSDWVFSFHECCRNCSITTINNPCSNSNELYVEAKLNNLLAPGNSSPSFSNLPVAFVCVGQNFTYNHGVLDVDGDSLSYSLIAPKISATNSVSFISPATAATPLKSSTPFTLNSITGDINFTSNAIQIGVMAVFIKEYRNGLLIGSVIRDMQVYTQNCSNAIPTASGINNTSTNTVTVCPDQTLCFDIYSNDTDASQNVTLTTNNGIPGATYIISGGNRPTLHFCWTPTYADANLLPNTFTVTVRDNACPSNGIQTYSYSVFVPSPYFSVASTAASCFGSNNGTLMAMPVYGNAYTYSWNTTPVSTSASVTGLPAGVYTVTVADNNQCSATASVSITQPDQLNLSIQKTDLICNGLCNGALDLSVSGGTLPYSYAWSNGQITQDLTMLCANTYTVTVTDANSCSALWSNEIIEPTALMLNLSGFDALCHEGMNGLADLEVSGGAPGYVYNWSNGASSQDISGLSPGTYTVSVYDMNQCSATTSIQINQPAFLAGMIVGNDISCKGGFGTADLTVSGGTPGYQYSWSNGQTTEDLPLVSAGTYTVFIYDANQCMTSASITLVEPDALFATVISDNGGCNSSAGSVDLTVGGGVEPYSYSWSNGETTEDIGNLASNIYTVVVIDANGCTLSSEVTIQTASTLGGILFTNDLQCHGDQNGMIDLTVSGGLSPYTYFWSNGETTEDISGLAAGTYTITVTDNQQCTFSATVQVSEPTVLSSGIMGIHALCNAGTGSIDFSITGGTAPYQYAWSNGETTEDIQGLMAGTYSVTVTDANGCMLLNQIELIGTATNLQITTSVYDVLCHGLSDGAVSLMVSGGSMPYTYNWSNGFTTQNQAQVTSGNYSVLVTDVNGCTAIAYAEVNEPELLNLVLTAQNGSCTGSNGAANLQTYGGTAPYQYVWSTGDTTEDLVSVSSGTYTVTVTDNHGCSSTVDVTITNTSFSIVLTPTQVSCNGGNNGSIVSLVTGGNVPYQFIWSNGETTPDIQNLLPGLYEVTVTDAFKCMASATILITEPELLDLKMLGYPVTCKHDGGINTWVSGGTEPYSYLWSTGETTSNSTSLQAGFYTVTITDANGCNIVGSATVNSIVPMLLTYNKSDATSNGAADGAIDLIVNGGIGPFSYSWTNGEITEDLTGLTAGIYDVVVTDIQDCDAHLSIVIEEPLINGVHENNTGFIFSLSPNPATDIIHLQFQSPVNGHISVQLFTMEGKLITTFFDQEIQKNTWEHIDYNVRSIAPGMYFYKIQSTGFKQTHKLLIQGE